MLVKTFGHPTYATHWIIAHGYFASTVDGNYIIANDGWGSNNVWFAADSVYLKDMVYFAS